MAHPDATLWAPGFEIGTEISPWEEWGGLDEAGNLIQWEEQFQARDLDDMLRRDGKARSLEQAITLPLRAVPLTISPRKGDRGEADFVNEVLDALEPNRQILIGWAVQSLIYRTTYLELVYGVRAGRTVYDRIAWRPPDSCAMIHDRETGALLGFRQEMGGPAKFGFVEIPNALGATKGVGTRDKGRAYGPPRGGFGATKALVFLHAAWRNPMRGASELAVCYRCYSDKAKVRYLWSKFLAGAAVPRTIAMTPQGKEAEVAAQLASLGSGGTAAVSADTKVQALDVAGTAAGSFLSMMQYLDLEMAGSVLAGFTELTSAAAHGSRGSMALAQEETNFFSQSLEAHAKEIAATLRSDAVAPLCRLNFGAEAVIPKVVIGPISKVSIQDAMTTLQTMAAANAQTSIVPAEFVDELTLRVSTLLDLDTDKIRAAIQRAGQQAAELPTPGGKRSAPVHAALGVAAGAIRRAEHGDNPLPAAS